MVHLSFGDTPATEYAWQLVADHVIHGWDLAVATGGDPRLDDELVAAVADWFADREDLYRLAGAIADRPEVARSTPQDNLLVAFGREPYWTPSHDVVRRFGAAWEAWDLDAIMALMADDAVFESTGPAPDGRRIKGRDAIRKEWQDMFDGTRDASFTFEESFVGGDRASARWVFAWTNDDGSPGHIRGVDAIKVRDGQIAEKLSYVKG
jgi:ketosteroid isomerase-like protein